MHILQPSYWNYNLKGIWKESYLSWPYLVFQIKTQEVGLVNIKVEEERRKEAELSVDGAVWNNS